jgi:hypothetical protein
VHRTPLRRAGRAGISVLAVIATLGACDTRTTTEPVFQPQVVVVPTEFAFQASALFNVSSSQDFVWQSAGGTATVSQLPDNLSGAVSLVVLDGAGTQVYQHALTDQGTFTTLPGVAGNWTVRVRLEGASGALTFRLTKP